MSQVKSWGCPSPRLEDERETLSQLTWSPWAPAQCLASRHHLSLRADRGQRLAGELGGQATAACRVVCGLSPATITHLGSLEPGLKGNRRGRLPARAGSSYPDIRKCCFLGKPEGTARWSLAQASIQFQASLRSPQSHRHSWALASATGEAASGWHLGWCSVSSQGAGHRQGT